ncbi:MAG: hypothetical protein IK015_06425 [Treponema sp.]|nr:hypothetical protein [Treponema sp.]
MKKTFLAFAILPLFFGGCMKLFDSDQTAAATIQNVNPTQPSNPNPSGVGSGGGTNNGGGTGGSGDAATYTITVQDGIAHGTVTCSARAAEGDTVTLTAIPESDYKLGALTVTAEDNTVVATSGTENARTFLMPAKNVVVRVVFRTICESGVYTELPAGTNGTAGKNWTYVTFGLWPQTIKAKEVNVDKSCESKVIGAFTGYKGSDGEWYVSVWERAYHSSCKYSNGEFAGLDSYHRNRWFKVEPIKWRVLTNNYNGTGKKLLLAEDVFMVGSYYDCYDSNYNGYTTRKIDGKSVLPGNYEHSRVRAGLNGLAYQIKEDYRDSIQHEVTGLVGKGFLKFAFTAEEQAQISVTNLDIVSGEGDKIFLLNSQEVVNADYGFNSGAGRYPTDYAIACGAYRNSYGYGFTPWWLRCVGTNGGSADAIGNDGKIGYGRVNRSDLGIVPALCVEN